MPVTSPTESSDRSRFSLWPALLLLFLLPLMLAVSPLLGWSGRIGRAHFGAGVYPETGRPQGFSYQGDAVSRDWCLRLGDWYWGVELVP